jgi:hypothetical protein
MNERDPMQHKHAKKKAPSQMLARCIRSALFVGLIFTTAPAQSQGHSIRQGVLTCRTSASIGLIVGSRQRLACQFKADRGWTQNYAGTIGRLGLDVGVTAGGVMVWAVLASTANVPRGALAGTFVGASGDASLGVGAGANLLVGGTRRSVSLQPLSLEGQVGVNLALGVARMRLVPIR